MEVTTDARATRRLAAALEPCVAQVYFAPEAHAAYAMLGFEPSPGNARGVALPDGPAYFTSRASLMGAVGGHVAAAAFAVFNPVVVASGVTHGWSLTDPDTIFVARRRAGVAQLLRITGLDPDAPELARAAELLARGLAPLQPEGRPLFAGGRDRYDDPAEAASRVFHLGDMLREFRGDSHTAAWVGAGLDAAEIGLLTELYLGLPPRSYVRTRAWSDGRLDAATETLQSRGWITPDAATLTEDGRTARDAIEVATDRQLAPLVAALGLDGVGELCTTLEPLGAAVRAAGGYLRATTDLWPNR